MWTQAYYGTQHTKKNKTGRWCTVTEHKQWAELLRWYPGCGTRPHESRHDTVEEARSAGEKWLLETA